MADRKDERQGGGASALIIAGAVSLLALPSAVLAFSSRVDIEPSDVPSGQAPNGFAPSVVDPRLARAIAAHPPGTGPLFRFTPAGLAARPDRSITVVQRIDPETARTIIVRAMALPRPLLPPAAPPPNAAAPAAYTLGIAHGYQGFALAGQKLTISGDSHHPDGMPSLQAFVPPSDSSASGQPSRLAPHIQLGVRDRVGRAPHTLESAGDQTVDLGGSYRLTRNINVTAGIRYSEDHDRLEAPNSVKQDNQAVFVGTQFHF